MMGVPGPEEGLPGVEGVYLKKKRKMISLLDDCRLPEGNLAQTQ